MAIRHFASTLLCLGILMGVTAIVRSERPAADESVLPEVQTAESEAETDQADDASTEADDEPEAQQQDDESSQEAAEEKTQEKKEEKAEEKKETPAAEQGNAEKKPTAKPVEAVACPPSPTYTVKSEPFRITVLLDGVFEAEKSEEIAIKPEEWNSLKVESAVAHGARVHKGEVILSLETKKIDQAIADLQTELKLSDVSIQQSEDQLQALEKIAPLDLDLSKRTARISGEDREYFGNTLRPFMMKRVDFSLKVAEENLAYKQEELNQLEKMYKADEITEETEAIVLKRAQDDVEKAKFMVEYVKLARDEVLKYDLPRSDESIEEMAKRTALDWEKTKLIMPLSVERQRLDLDRQKMQRDKNRERLKNLQADREMMTVQTPIDGIVYYGKAVRGKFSDSTAMADRLCRNGTIVPDQVVMTVVALRPMNIKASVPEGQLHHLRTGMEGVATPDGYPDLKLDAEIDEISDIPVAPGSFEAQLSVRLARKAKALMPGMTCKVKLVPYLKKDALCIPPKCLHADELDDEKQYVWLLDQDGKPQRREVSVGKKNDRQIEILKGLDKGDKVLLDAPKDEK